MRCLYHLYVGLLVAEYCSALRSISDFTDTGNCVGEISAGNSPFVPQHYSLYLDLNPELKNFRGDVNIYGTLNEGTNLIVLHSVKLNVSSVRVNGIDHEDWYMEYMDYANGSLSIKLTNETFGFNYDNFSVGVSYEGVFDETTGIIMQNYSENDNNSWTIFTHLEPSSARRVFPSIDLPRYKAKFDISINKTNFQDRTVLSNMPLKSSDTNVIEFQTTPLMSTYLVALVICDYVPLKYKSFSRYSVKNVTTWVPKEMKGKYGAGLIRLQTPQILEALENYYGSDYSLPKLDMYVVMEKPGIGGMENWGLIMYQVDSFVQDKRAVANDQRKVISTIAHELAHHWSGNSVTVADWCGVWLQEAIPTFLSGYITQQLFGDLDEVNTVKWSARMEAMSEECRITDPSPLRDDQLPMKDPSTLFVRSQYLKGANLLYMIESIVTPEVFKKSLRSLFETYNNSFAEEIDLWKIVDESCGEGGFQKKLNAPMSLSEMATTWVTYPSHPVVVLERNENGTISLTQEVCSRYSTQSLFWIPVSYTTSKAPDFKITTPQAWIIPGDPDDDYEEIPTVMNIKLAKEDWIILNIMGSGYYRVDYDDVTWDRLISQLESDTKCHPEEAVIPPIHRAMLVDDSFHTANTGKSLIKTFKILGYIKRETSDYVWGAVKENLQDSYDLFPSAEKELFKKYVQFLLKDVFKRVTDVARWRRANRKKLEPVSEKILRETVFELAYRMELPALYTFSRRIAVNVINEDMNDEIIPSEVERWLWCAAVSTGDKENDDEIFKYVRGAYDAAKSHKRKTHILKSLECSKDNNEQLLNLILENNGGESKVTLRAEIMEFLLSHWPAGCKETLSFLEREKKQLVDDESEWSEFQRRVKNPPTECKEQAERLFGHTEPTDDETDESWRKMYGEEPLNWLRNHSHQWK